MKNFLLNIEYGGLGDHLFYSPLPRLLKQEHGDDCKVYLSSKSYVRNQETFEFVWERNPFLDGLKDPDSLNFEKLRPVNLSENYHVIQEVLAWYSLDHSVEVEPEVYCDPEVETGSPERIVDLNYSSYTGLLDSDLLRIAKKLRGDYFFVNPSEIIMKVIPPEMVVRTSSLFHYAGLIKNAKQFFCLTSGGATLARALGIVANVFIEPNYPRRFMHSNNNHIRIAKPNIYRGLVCNYLWRKNIKRRAYEK